MLDLLRAILEAGRRHSAGDERLLQDIHDAAIGLGAACAANESAPLVYADALTEALGLSHGQLAELIRAALAVEHPGDNASVWARDIYDDAVVYEVAAGGEPPTVYRRSYSVLDGAVAFGDPVEVVAVVDYVPVGEADRIDEAASGVAAWMRKHGGAHPFSACMGKFRDARLCAKAKDVMTGTTAWRGKAKESGADAVELTGELVPLTEKAVAKDGGIKLKIIQAGQGSSGYYPADVLKRDGPKVFTAGLHMHLDHPSASEESDRPERSITTLAGTLTGDARWEEQGPAGPGLYADARVRSDLAPLIEELAPHIGVSIRALGRAGTQEIGGKRIRTVEAIEQAKSVDFVTVPGAGGRVLDLVEAARQGITPAGGAAREDDGMDEKLSEANAKIEELTRRLDEAERRERDERLAQEARGVVVEALAASALPQVARDRLVGRLAADPPTADGALDRAALVARVAEAAGAEAEYLASVPGRANPVAGMGGAPAGGAAAPTLDEAERRIAAALGYL